MKSHYKKKRKGPEFFTTHEEVDKAVADYLENGGEITKTEFSPRDVNYSDKSMVPLVDDFLAGKYLI